MLSFSADWGGVKEVLVAEDFGMRTRARFSGGDTGATTKTPYLTTRRFETPCTTTLHPFRPSNTMSNTMDIENDTDINAEIRGSSSVDSERGPHLLRVTDHHKIRNLVRFALDFLVVSLRQNWAKVKPWF